MLRLSNHVGGGIEIDSTFEEFVNPEIPIPAASTKVHGITDERVANMPKIGEMLLHFKEFCPEGSVLIAHNGDNFDKIVLEK